MVGLASGFLVEEILGISMPAKAEKKPRDYNPYFLRNYDGVFSDECLEDYRLAKLKVLTDEPSKIIADLEERTGYAMASLDGNRRELTEEVYSKLYAHGLRIAWKQSRTFSSIKLDRILREGEIEDLVQNSVLKCLNSVVTYKPVNSFNNWFWKILHNGLVDLLRLQVNNENRKVFSELFPEITQYAMSKIDMVAQRSGYNFRSYMQDPLVKVVGDETIRRVNEGFQLLREDQKTALAYAAQKIDYNVAAAMMQRSEGEFRLILHRARSALATYLALVGVELPRSYKGVFKESVSRLVNELLEDVEGKRYFASKKEYNKGRISQDLNIAATVFRENYIGDISRSELAHTWPGMYSRLREIGLLDYVIPEKQKPGRMPKPKTN